MQLYFKFLEKVFVLFIFIFEMRIYKNIFLKKMVQ